MADATPSPGAFPLPPPPPAQTSCAVTVAVHVRPLAPHEGTGPPAVVGVRPPPTATSGSGSNPAPLPSVTCGGQAFTVDAVYDSAAGAHAPHAHVDHRPALYAEQVAPLIAGLFAGVNAAVFAYGATGAGKTHTMGLAWEGGEAGGSTAGPGAAAQGIIPRAVADVFATAEALTAASAGPGPDPAGRTTTTTITVRASFVEC